MSRRASLPDGPYEDVESTKRKGSSRYRSFSWDQFSNHLKSNLSNHFGLSCLGARIFRFCSFGLVQGPLSCSDKMAQWSALGLGNLDVSGALRPFHLASCTVGAVAGTG